MKLLLSGSKGLSQYEICADGSYTLLAQAQKERLSFCAVGPVYIVAVDEDVHRSAFLLFDKSLSLCDQWEISASQLCHVFYSQEDSVVYGSCYGTGHLVALTIENGRFCAGKQFVIGQGYPGRPRAHCAVLAPDRRRLLVTSIDQDCIFSFPLDAGLSKTPDYTLTLPRQTGPRHIRFHPHASLFYVITEYSNEVLAVAYDLPTGRMELVQSISTLPKEFRGESFGSALVVSGDVSRLYAANRGADTIAQFDIQKNQTLRYSGAFPCGGHWPRHIELAQKDAALLVANERSDTVSVLSLAQNDAGRVLAQIPFTHPGFACELEK